MEETINQWILNYGLIAIFLLMVFNGFISTPPSELTLSLSGVIAYTTQLPFLFIILVAIAGNFFGMYLPYIIGRQIGFQWIMTLKEKLAGKGRLLRWCSEQLPDRKTIVVFADLFKGRGAIWVGIFRCFPMVRSTITSLPAGVIKMPHIKFSLFSLAGIVVWVLFWTSIGYSLGESWHEVKTVGTIVLSFTLIGIILFLKHLAKKYIKQRISDLTQSS